MKPVPHDDILPIPRSPETWNIEGANKGATMYEQQRLVIKTFVKAMNKDGEGFQYLRLILLEITDAKTKEGISVGQQTGHR